MSPVTVFAGCVGKAICSLRWQMMHYHFHLNCMAYAFERPVDICRAVVTGRIISLIESSVHQTKAAVWLTFVSGGNDKHPPCLSVMTL